MRWRMLQQDCSHSFCETGEDYRWLVGIDCKLAGYIKMCVFVYVSTGFYRFCDRLRELNRFQFFHIGLFTFILFRLLLLHCDPIIFDDATDAIKVTFGIIFILIIFLLV